MPGGISGLQLIEVIRNRERYGSETKIKIALNTADDAFLTVNLSKKYDFTPILKGDLKLLESFVFGAPDLIIADHFSAMTIL